jgi:hypothetical protein
MRFSVCDQKRWPNPCNYSRIAHSNLGYGGQHIFKRLDRDLSIEKWWLEFCDGYVKYIAWFFLITTPYSDLSSVYFSDLVNSNLRLHDYVGFFVSNWFCVAEKYSWEYCYRKENGSQYALCIRWRARLVFLQLKLIYQMLMSYDKLKSFFWQIISKIIKDFRGFAKCYNRINCVKTTTSKRR